MFRVAATSTEANTPARGNSHAAIAAQWITRSFRKRRAPGKFALGAVADVAEVGDADFAGVVAVASHVAKKREERNALAERGILPRVFAEGNEVENFLFLFWSTLEKKLAAMIRGVSHRPKKYTANRQTPTFIYSCYISNHC